MEPPASPALPEAFREKYQAVRRAHNDRVLLLLVAVTILVQGAGFGTRGQTPDRRNELLVVLTGAVVGVAAVGGYRVRRMDRRQCAALCLWCSRCRKPLYRLGCNVLQTGLCPHCHQIIPDETRQS